MHSVFASPLQPWHESHGARFVDGDGWARPASYAGVEAETASTRNGLGIADLSAFVKLRLIGNVGSVVKALGGGAALQPRGVSVSHRDGRLLACRLTRDSLLLLHDMTDATRLPQCLASIPAVRALVQAEATFALVGFCLAGPQVEHLLPRLTSLDLRNALPEGGCAETGFAGVHALLVRAGELTVPSVRVYVSWDLAAYVWERLLDVGRGYGLVPIGHEAMAALALSS